MRAFRRLLDWAVGAPVPYRTLSLEDSVWLASIAEALEKASRVRDLGQPGPGREESTYIQVTDALAKLWVARLKRIAGEG